MTVTTPDSHNRRKSGVRSGVVSAMSRLREEQRVAMSRLREEQTVAKRLTCLRLQPLDARASQFDPVVQPVLSALPELDHLGTDQVPTPIRRDGHLVAIGETRSDLRKLCQQVGPRSDRLRLRRRPRAQLRTARAL